VTGEIPLVSQSSAFFGAGKRPEPATSKEGKILTVYGKEDIEDHDLKHLSQEINVIGKHVQVHGGKRVAIYLPNSVELLTTLFGMEFVQVTLLMKHADTSP
jgi:hypothetical protein